MKNIFAFTFSMLIFISATAQAAPGDAMKEYKFRNCKKILMYTLTKCPACKVQKQILDEGGVPFTELDAQKERKYARQLQEKARAAGWRQLGYPTLQVGEELVAYPAKAEDLKAKACGE